MLDNQVALVSGASRGIGRAIAIRLGKAGAKVIGTATSDAGVSAISSAFKESNINGMGVVLNVTDDNLNASIETLQAEVGNISILVNNAGITRDGLLLRMKEQDWDDIMQTNLKSVFRLSQSVLQTMVKARYGRIITVSSVVGALGNAGQTNYAAAKAGVIGFSKSLAREVGTRNITVNCVAPGFIDTDMTRALSDEHRQKLLGAIPLGRLGNVEDIAAAVAFLASPDASYITGTTLHVNGGMYMN